MIELVWTPTSYPQAPIQRHRRLAAKVLENCGLIFPASPGLLFLAGRCTVESQWTQTRSTAAAEMGQVHSDMDPEWDTFTCCDARTSFQTRSKAPKAPGVLGPEPGLGWLQRKAYLANEGISPPQQSEHVWKHVSSSPQGLLAKENASVPRNRANENSETPHCGDGLIQAEIFEMCIDRDGR